MKKQLLPIIAILILMTAILVGAQDNIEPAPGVSVIDPNANISWPPPVYIARGQVEIVGTVNLPEMVNFFLEFRPLVLIPGAEDVVDNPWRPASLASNIPAVDGVLGAWDTTLSEDGLYELRLTINTSTNEPRFVRLSPLRIENDVTERSIGLGEAQPVPGDGGQQPLPATQPAPGGQATAVPQASATPQPASTSPQLTITHATGANVRQGPATNFALYGSIPANEVYDILAVNPAGDWYKIQYYNAQGWVWAPLVATEGNLSALPVDAGPPTPVPPTATPIPPPTAIPVAVNLEIVNIQIAPHPLVCSEDSAIEVTIRNTGSEATSQGGLIKVAGILASDGRELGSTNTVFPALQPGASYTAGASLAINIHHSELQRIAATVDSDNRIPESNENDNTRSDGTDYILAKGGCP